MQPTYHLMYTAEDIVSNTIHLSSKYPNFVEHKSSYSLFWFQTEAVAPQEVIRMNVIALRLKTETKLKHQLTLHSGKPFRLGWMVHTTLTIWF